VIVRGCSFSRELCLTCDTFGVMGEVTVRELRNHGGEVIDRVAGGETVTVTRAGKEVAELSPLPRPPLKATALLARWKRLPPFDPREVRADIDAVIDPSL
jgi:prevent-host-death family protein